MARENFGRICSVRTIEKRLIGLVVALVLGPASWAWADTINWPFTTAGNYIVSDATKVEIVAGVAKLIAIDQTDNDNTSTGFGGGTHNETQWDGTNNWLELTATGQTNGSGDFVSRVMDAGTTVAWDSISWTPQRPLYKELPNNKGVESAYPTGNADMTGNVLLMHMNETSGTIVDYSGEGNNGTITGATYGASGKLNTALSFDGVDDYVDVADAVSLDITDAITIEAWMNPLAGGGTIGNINDTIIDTLEFDAGSGYEPNIIHVSGNVYAIAYRGIDGDGFLKTVEIATNGQITDSVIDSLEFDAGSGYEPNIIHVSGNVYAIAYRGIDDDGFLKTVEIATNGQITDTVIDSLEFDTDYGYEPDIIHVSGNIYAIAHRGAQDDGFLKTVEIATNGQITDAVIDTLEFDAWDGYTPNIIHVSGNVYALAYRGRFNDGFLKTVEIATNGQITDTVIDALEFDTRYGGEPNINPISGNVYAIAYKGKNELGTLKTVEIAANGQITDTVIDALKYDNALAYTPDLIPVSRNVYAVAYGGPFTDGFLKTVEIATNGQITDAVIGSLEFDTDQGAQPDIIHVSGNVYTIAYNGPADNGFLKTVEIITNKGLFKAGAYEIDADTATAFASINDQTISGAISSGWNHVVLIYDKNAGSDQQTLYVNGVSTATANLTDAINTNANSLIVGQLFKGTIDETAIYNRALSATEILDHYKRGAVRLKCQVRSGSTNPPAGNFIGPDGTTGSFYSELSNSTTGLPSLSLTNVSDNRYFQYKAYLETDTSSYSPELKSLVIGPAHYPSDNPTVQNNTGQTYVALDSLVETLGGGNAGSVKYQISNNGTNWYYWNSANWVAASGYSQTNIATEVNTNCGQFDDDVGAGDFYFKAFLHSDAAAQQVELDQVDLGYTPKVISVSVSNSTFAFGTSLLNTWLTPQTSVITNDGNVAENFIGQISQFTDGSNTWEIAISANGADTTRAQWSTTSETGPWTDISAYDTDFTIATNVAASDSVLFWFRIETPTGTSSYNEYSSTLTVTAQEY